MTPAAEPELFYPNGLDARTGRPARPPVRAEDLEMLAFGPLPPRPPVEEEEPVRRLRRGIAADDLAATGWALLVPERQDPRVIEALEPLLERRREQAGGLYVPPIAVRAGEEVDRLFQRLGVSPTSTEPEELPYYLLIAGSPEEIPFGTQQALAQGRAVGRLHLAAPADYRVYAENVVAAEERPRRDRPEIAYFAADNGDRPTLRTRRELVEPLAAALADRRPAWRRRELLAGDASKQGLRTLFADAAPHLLFTATHGLGRAYGEQGQEDLQGALVTSDWPGENGGVEWGPDCYLAAADLPGELGSAGGVAFLYACYSAGTPDSDQFWFRGGESPPERLALRPFVSRLAQALLSRRGGPAAVIGHVDRAWTCSFSWHRGGQTGAYEDTLLSLMDGEPVGHAMEWLGDFHSKTAAKLVEITGRRDSERPFDAQLLSRYRLAAHDAANFIVCGDPAVRLPIE